MKLKITLGQDLSAYAEIEVEVPEGAPEEVIAEAVMEKFEADPYGEDIVFSEDWGTTCSLRIVSARDADDNSVAQDVALDPIPFDGGQALCTWLMGYSEGGLVAVVNAAARAKLIDKPVLEAHRGMFTLGAETVDVEFECRKGATREEMDLAFFARLAQVAHVDYVATGEADHE